MPSLRRLGGNADQTLAALSGHAGAPFEPGETYVSVVIKGLCVRRGGVQLGRFAPYVHATLGQPNFDREVRLSGLFAPSRGPDTPGGAAPVEGSQVGAPVAPRDQAPATSSLPESTDLPGRVEAHVRAPMPELGFRRQDRVLVFDRQLTPRLVYRGDGPFEIGFGSILERDYFSETLGLVEDVVKTPVAQFVSTANPALGQALQSNDISDSLSRALDLVRDRKGAVQLASLASRLSTFDADGGAPDAGLYALVADSSVGADLDYDADSHGLVDRRGRAYRGAPYLVFELRRETTRPDWGNVPDVNTAWRMLDQQVRQGDPKGALNAFHTAVFLSPDLVAADSKRIYMAAKRKLAPLMGNAEFFHLPKLASLGAALKPYFDELLAADKLGARDEWQSFLRCHEVMRVNEGGYVDHPDDPGGATNMGVTQRTYDTWRRKQGLSPRSVRDIEEAEVKRIYFEGYWRAGHCHRMPDDATALVLFDACVNHGLRPAMKFIQRGAGLPAGEVDGYYGPRTAAAVDRADPGQLVDRALDARWRYFERIMRSNPRLESFRNGWKNRVDSLRRITGAWLSGQESVSRPPPLSDVEQAEPELDPIPPSTDSDLAGEALT